MNNLTEKFLKDFLNQLETTKLIEIIKGLIDDSSNASIDSKSYEYKDLPEDSAILKTNFTDINDLRFLKDNITKDIKNYKSLYNDYCFCAFEYLLKAADEHANFLATLQISDLNTKFNNLSKKLIEDTKYQNYYNFWNTLSHDEKNSLLFEFTMLKYSSKLMPEDETQSFTAALRKEGALSLPNSNVLKEVFKNPEVSKFAKESFLKQLEAENSLNVESYIKEPDLQEISK